MENKNGFGILEALVATILLGIVSAGMVTLVTNMARSQTMVSTRAESLARTGEIRSLLGSPKDCKRNLQGQPLPNNPGPAPLGMPTMDNPVGQLTDANGNRVALVEATSSDPKYPFHVEKMSLTNYVDLAGQPGFGYADLIIWYSADREALGPKSMTGIVKLSTHKTGGVLDECVSMSNMTDGIWQYVPATNFDINFNRGRVGVNVGTGGATAVPGAALHARALSATEPAAIFEGDVEIPAPGKLKATLACRVVREAPVGVGGQAVCAANEYVVGGGGRCAHFPDWSPSGIQRGFVHTSAPTSDLRAWIFNCFAEGGGSDVASEAFAICCEKGGP